MSIWKTYRSSNDPVLPRHKLSSSDREVTHLKCLDKSLKRQKNKLACWCVLASILVWRCFSIYYLWSYLCFVVPHTDAAVVQASQHPWFCWVKIHTLHSVRSGCQPPLDVQPQRLRNTKIMWIAFKKNAVILWNRTALLLNGKTLSVRW